MKNLLLASLLLVCCSAEAKIVAESLNQSGGKMVLTTEKCTNSTGYVAYSVMENNPTLLGCWLNDDDFIHIRWSDGDLRSYPYNVFIIKDKPKSTM